jgi:glutamyl-tRNA synthetase
LAALGLAPPQYGHISMIVGADGAPLSKRTGSRSLRELRAEGFLPLALVNYLARLGHHYEDARLMSLDELAQAFSLDRLGRAPARFDVEQLTHWQREAVARLEEEAFWHWVGVETASSVPTVQRTAFVDAVRHNVTFPAQVNAWAQRVFNDVCQYNDLARQVLVQTGPAFFAQAQEQVDDRVPDFKTLTTRIKDATGAKGKALFHPVRVALTGELDGPEMGKLVALFSPDRLRARFAAAGRIAGTES